MEKQAEQIDLEDAINGTNDLSSSANELSTHLNKIDAEYGDSLPYNYRGAINYIKQQLAIGAMAMLEAGKALVVLKEHEPHGGFMEAIKEIGIEHRVANNLMKVALKFENRNSNMYSNLNYSKLLELSFLDDKDLDLLESGGSVADIKLDDMDRMSVRELKAALKEKDEQLSAKDSVIEQNNKTIESQAKQLNRLSKQGEAALTPDEEENLRTLSYNLTEAVAGIELFMKSIDPTEYDLLPKYVVIASEKLFTDLKNTKFRIESLMHNLKPIIDANQDA